MAMICDCQPSPYNTRRFMRRRCTDDESPAHESDVPTEGVIREARGYGRRETVSAQRNPWTSDVLEALVTARINIRQGHPEQRIREAK